MHLIFFGFSAGEEHGAEAELKEMILTFFHGLSNSSFHEILTQYFDTLGQVAPTVTVDDWIDPTPPIAVEYTKVQQQVKAAIEANKEHGWKAEPNAQFMVVTAPGATYKFGEEFCAFHGVAGLSGLGATAYSFIPYDGDEPFKHCSNPPRDVQGNPVHSSSKSASHEYAETVTDPFPETEAWKTTNGEEIGDMCQFNPDFELKDAASEHGAWAQELFDDYLNRCATEDPAPPEAYAVTGTATSPTETGATLTGTVNPEGLTGSSYHFEYGIASAHEASTPSVSMAAGSRHNETVAVTLTGLQLKATYHYRLVATAAAGRHPGTTDGREGSFSTVVPTIREISPNTGPEAGGTSVAIKGDNLNTITAVKFGETEASSFTIDSETEVTAISPPGEGIVDITATNVNATSQLSAADRYTYGAPKITSVRPDWGPEAGGTEVTLTGVRFTGATAVKFGSTPAQRFRVVSDTSIVALSPPGAGGVFDVTVTGPEGTSRINPADLFLYQAPTKPVGPLSWGINFYGQLGNGTTQNTDLAGPVNGLTEVTAVAAGREHSLALLSDGKVMAWGQNIWGQLGNGTTSDEATVKPVEVQGLSGVKAIAAGGMFSLALRSDGTVWAWGRNVYGELGDGSTINSDVPVAVSGLSGVTAVAAGGDGGGGGRDFALALLENGTVMAWGNNHHGQLGNGSQGKETNTLPKPVSGLNEVSAISAGGEHSLALRNGAVQGWGFDTSGQLGDGSKLDKDVPVAVSGLNEVSAISAGGAHSLALLKGGTVKAWGRGQAGELGNASEESDTPVTVGGLSEVKAIAAGGETAGEGDYNLALMSNGTVEAWGSNYSGQLGDLTSSGPEHCLAGGVACSKTPVPVTGLSGVGAISAGGEDGLVIPRH